MKARLVITSNKASQMIAMDMQIRAALGEITRLYGDITAAKTSCVTSHRMYVLGNGYGALEYVEGKWELTVYRDALDGNGYV
jgi:hypothetical protein